eukprot:scaffold3618_cov1120-Pavlova_lutheri.AAC.1
MSSTATGSRARPCPRPRPRRQSRASSPSASRPHRQSRAASPKRRARARARARAGRAAHRAQVSQRAAELAQALVGRQSGHRVQDLLRELTCSPPATPRVYARVRVCAGRGRLAKARQGSGHRRIQPLAAQHGGAQHPQLGQRQVARRRSARYAAASSVAKSVRLAAPSTGCTRTRRGPVSQGASACAMPVASPPGIRHSILLGVNHPSPSGRPHSGVGPSVGPARALRPPRPLDPEFYSKSAGQEGVSVLGSS